MLTDAIFVYVLYYPCVIKTIVVSYFYTWNCWSGTCLRVKSYLHCHSNDRCQVRTRIWVGGGIFQLLAFFRFDFIFCIHFVSGRCRCNLLVVTVVSRDRNSVFLPVFVRQFGRTLRLTAVLYPLSSELLHFRLQLCFRLGVTYWQSRRLCYRVLPHPCLPHRSKILSAFVVSDACIVLLHEHWKSRFEIFNTFTYVL